MPDELLQTSGWPENKNAVCCFYAFKKTMYVYEITQMSVSIKK